MTDQRTRKGWGKTIPPASAPAPVFDPVDGRSFHAIVDPYAPGCTVRTGDGVILDRLSAFAARTGDIVVSGLGLEVSGFSPTVMDIHVPGAFAQEVVENLANDLILELVREGGRTTVITVPKPAD